METTFVALIAYAVFTLTGGYGATIILLITQGGLQKLTPAQFQELAMQWRWQGVGLIIACPSTIAVVWVAVRMAGRDFAEYLALNWPSRKELLIALRWLPPGSLHNSRCCPTSHRPIHRLL